MKRNKKVLYISNIEVPYRTKFFNKLSKECELTVLYERRKSKNRNEKWVSEEKATFNVQYLDGINIKNEYSIGLKINKYIFDNYDVIIFGCCNSPIQVYGIAVMRLLKKEYYVNLDGEYFIEGSNLKSKIKRIILNNATGYFIAGSKNGEKLRKLLKSNNVTSYNFSSLTKNDLKNNSYEYQKNNKGDYIIVVGQYFDYKGLDLALEVAKELPDVKFKFIGMNKRANLFKEEVAKSKVQNIEIIPFLSKEKLNEEYKNCKMLLLTSRKECWGLVINEAASFGCPILASKYAGAAVEFLKDKYSDYLIDPYCTNEIVTKIKNYKEDKIYKTYLVEESSKYSIETNVQDFVKKIYKEKL